MIGAIHAYRVGLSWQLGGRCRFAPSCSDYGLQALRQHGAWRGLFLILWRLGRCHPLHAGGYDPVPVSVPERAPT